jgi:hypothetical protein
MVSHAAGAVAREQPSLSNMPLDIHHTLPREAVHALTAAVAQEIHKVHGGNEVLDWLEAEMLVQNVLERGGIEGR